MFAVDVCRLPETGGSLFVVVAGLFLLVAGVLVARWVRASASRMSVVVAPLLLLGGLVLAPSVIDPCSPTTTVATTTTTVATTATTVAATTTTTVAPTTTVVPVDPNLVLEIDTTVLAPVEIDSVTAADDSFVFELGLFGEVDVHVDWGDELADDVSDAGPFQHTYTTSGEYTITVSGSLTGFGQDPLNFVPMSGADYLRAVRSFGELGITSLTYAFYGAVNLVDVPSTLPATVKDMSNMFEDASSFNGDVSGWNTGRVWDMNSMFSWATAFNQSVSAWDTGQVSNMSFMFYDASSFNQSLGAWDISAVVDMSNMLDDSALSVDNYDATLNGWADTLQVKQSNVVLGAAGLFFTSNGSLAHDTLTNPCGNNPSNWQINDSGLDQSSLTNNNQSFAVVCN